MPTTDCIPPIELQFQRRRIEVAGDAPTISSDGGVVLLRQVDEKIGLTSRFGRLLPDDRYAQRVRHSRSCCRRAPR